MKEKGHKIVALAPSLTETIYALGSGHELVGVSSGCNYPPSAKMILQVSNISDINLELLLQLKPDIVFLLPYQTSFKRKLNELRIRTAVIKQKSLDDILNSFVEIGRYVNKINKAQSMQDSLRTIIGEYKRKDSNFKALICSSREYGTKVKYIYSTGQTGFLNDILKLFGLKNSLNTDIPYPKISAETILTLNPDIIIDLVPGSIDLTEDELHEDWKILDKKNTDDINIFIIKGDHTTIPGPRVIDLIKDIDSRLPLIK